MQIEIEKKAWVYDREALLFQLKKKALYLGKICKKDRYFTLTQMPTTLRKLRKERKEPETLLLRDIPMVRLRDSKKDFPRDSKKIWVTRKKKSRDKNHYGIEINEEIEFSISEPKSFEKFLTYLGLEKKITKNKEVELFEYKDIRLELVDIETLGTFLEAEILIQTTDSSSNEPEKNKSEQKKPNQKEEKLNSNLDRNTKSKTKQIEEAIQKIETAFQNLNISKQNIEEKMYIELLWEKQSSRDTLYAKY